VFCGTFDTKGAKFEISDKGLKIVRPGEVRKLVKKVEQITYCGRQAALRGHKAVFITERAVFELTPDGVVLTEIAPDIDLRRDVLDVMGFKPLMPTDPRRMDLSHFAA
jgi:propionate CoA-transferase